MAHTVAAVEDTLRASSRPPAEWPARMEIRESHATGLRMAWLDRCGSRLLGDELADELARLDALCEISGIGLVTFDAEDPKAPGFQVHVRPRPHQPDYFYTNRYLSLIERELFS